MNPMVIDIDELYETDELSIESARVPMLKQENELIYFLFKVRIEYGKLFFFLINCLII